MDYKLEEYKDASGDHRNRITAHNGHIVSGTTQGYANRGDMRKTQAKVGAVLLKEYGEELSRDELGVLIVELHRLHMKKGSLE